MSMQGISDYIFAGSLVDPWKSLPSPMEQPISNSDVERILRLLKRNKVPLVFLDHGNQLNQTCIFQNEQFIHQHDEEKTILEDLRREWAEVRKNFIRDGIESMLIKSVDYFPLKCSNLDVLIKQEKRDRAEEILREMGYIQLHNVEEPYKTLFRKFQDGISVSVIHLHDKVAWINPFHDEKLLWSRYRSSKKDPLVEIPSPEDSILILTAHWFYEDKEIKLSDISNISECLKNGELDWEYVIRVAEKIGWIDGLYFGLLVQSFVEIGIFGKTSISEERIQDMRAKLPRWMRSYLDRKIMRRRITLPFKLPKIFGKYLHFVKTAKDSTITTRRKLWEMFSVAYASLFVVLFEKFKINIRHQPPMLITISGVDGSGKTTYAEALLNMLRFCELRTRYIWFRVGSSSFLKPFSIVAKFVYKIRRENPTAGHLSKSENPATGTKELFKRSPAIRFIGLILLFLEMVWQHFIRIKYHIFLNRIVVCDRYIYDTFVDMSTRYGINLKNGESAWFEKLLTKISPKADISYVLLLPLEEVASRRNFNEKEINQIKDQIVLYKQIPKSYNVREIETNHHATIFEISHEMIQEVLMKYYGNWGNQREMKE